MSDLYALNQKACRSAIADLRARCEPPPPPPREPQPVTDEQLLAVVDDIMRTVIEVVQCLRQIEERIDRLERRSWWQRLWGR